VDPGTLLLHGQTLSVRQPVGAAQAAISGLTRRSASGSPRKSPFPSSDAWIPSSSTPPGCSPSPSWRRISAYVRPGTRRATPGAPQVGLRVPLYVATTAERRYAEPRASTMAAMQGLAIASRTAPSRVWATTGDWERSGRTRAKHDLRTIGCGTRWSTERRRRWSIGFDSCGRAGPDADPVRGQTTGASFPMRCSWRI